MGAPLIINTLQTVRQQAVKNAKIFSGDATCWKVSKPLPNQEHADLFSKTISTKNKTQQNQHPEFPPSQE